MSVINAIMSRISKMFQFLLGRKQPQPPVYYSRSAAGSNAYTAPVGVKIFKG